MSETARTRRRPSHVWVPFFLAMPLAAWFARDLTSTYGLSTGAMLAVGATAWGTYSSCLEWLFKTFTRTTYRCPQPACTFSVRLSGTDAGENRRWQEIAHTHPHHGRF